jgi:hypothetical protein
MQIQQKCDNVDGATLGDERPVPAHLSHFAISESANPLRVRSRYRVKRHLTFAVCRITFPLMIRSFRNRALRRYFEAGDPSGLSVPNVARVGRMLPDPSKSTCRASTLASAARRSPLEHPSNRKTGGSPLAGMAPMPSPSIWRDYH